jgi:hypothetical protein
LAREETEKVVEDRVLIGYALDASHLPDGSRNPFVRVELEHWVIRLALQLRQFKTVDLEKML